MKCWQCICSRKNNTSGRELINFYTACIQLWEVVLFLKGAKLLPRGGLAFTGIMKPGPSLFIIPVGTTPPAQNMPVPAQKSPPAAKSSWLHPRLEGSWLHLRGRVLEHLWIAPLVGWLEMALQWGCRGGYLSCSDWWQAMLYSIGVDGFWATSGNTEVSLHPFSVWMAGGGGVF